MATFSITEETSEQYQLSEVTLTFDWQEFSCTWNIFHSTRLWEEKTKIAGKRARLISLP